jgi:hypothetical protein
MRIALHRRFTSMEAEQTYATRGEAPLSLQSPPALSMSGAGTDHIITRSLLDVDKNVKCFSLHASFILDLELGKEEGQNF